MKKALLATAMVLALAAILIASLVSQRRQGKGTEVRTELAKRAEISQIIKASGEIDPRIKVNISAHVIGKIDRLFVEEGDDIEAGQPFLRLEQEAFTANRDRAAAQVEIARSLHRQAEINLEDAGIRERRARRLHDEKVIPQESLDQSELALKSAELSLEQAREAVSQAKAELAKAQDDLSKTTIFAPLSGRVIALSAEEGEVVVSGTMNNPASVIGTIADLSEILVEVDVDENEIVDAQPGQSAEILVDAIPDHPYHGHVVEIGSSGYHRPAQPDVTFFKVKVLLDDPDERLRAGMSARADIEVDSHPNALLVPIQAVVYRRPVGTPENEDADEIKVVFVHRDGKAEQTPVTDGISDATNIEILAGLEDDAEVVVGPYRALKALKNEDRIKIKKDDSQSNGQSSQDDKEDDGEPTE